MKNKKECVIANEVKQSQTRKGLLRHEVPRNDDNSHCEKMRNIFVAIPNS